MTLFNTIGAIILSFIIALMLSIWAIAGGNWCNIKRGLKEILSTNG